MSSTASAETAESRLARVKRIGSMILTHIGRKSGKAYQVRIWFTVDGDHINLQTMNMKRQWIHNVLANPKVSLRIGDEVFEGSATPVTDPSDMQRIVELMKRKYPISLPYLWLKKQPAGAFHVCLEQAGSRA
jgi:deazaflavin-dependent oxidoreductase (nitroreductase family)